MESFERRFFCLDEATVALWCGHHKRGATLFQAEKNKLTRFTYVFRFPNGLAVLIVLTALFGLPDARIALHQTPCQPNKLTPSNLIPFETEGL